MPRPPSPRSGTPCVRHHDGVRATSRDDGVWFTVRDGASRAAQVTAIRAALIAQRDRLERVSIDVLSDDEWPDETCAAVRTAEARLVAQRRRSTSLTLDPRSDDDLGLAIALAPHTIGGSATDDTGALVWDSYDTGTSAAFRLTSSEVSSVRAAVQQAGGRHDDVVTLVSHHLGCRELSYDVVGATAAREDVWRPPSGWRPYERTVRLGAGPELWEAVSTSVVSWEVKTRSGFAVDPPLRGLPSRAGDRCWLVARLGPFRLREPVQVVETVSSARRAALAYGTLDGHPATGEEAFIVHRDDDGTVRLTLRSLTRPGRGLWRVLFPAILVAQRLYRRRYLRALAPSTGARRRARG